MSEIYQNPDEAVDALAAILEPEPEEPQEASETQPEEVAEDHHAMQDEDIEDDFVESSAEEDDDGNDDESVEENLYTVVVDGVEEQVPLQELINGHQRLRDYTQKTQKIAAERKQMAEVTSAMQNELQQIRQFAEELQAVPDIPEPQIDWDHLYSTDSVEWVRQKELARERQELRNQRSQQLQKLYQQQEQLQQQQMTAHIKEQQSRLLEMVPEWRDAEIAKKEKPALRQFAMSEYGMSEQDVSQAYSAVMIKMLRDAYLYHQGKQKVQKVSRGEVDQPPKVKGRTYRQADPRRKQKRTAVDRLRRSGKVEDAAAAFEAILR